MRIKCINCCIVFPLVHVIYTVTTNMREAVSCDSWVWDRKTQVNMCMYLFTEAFPPVIAYWRRGNNNGTNFPPPPFE